MAAECVAKVNNAQAANSRRKWAMHVLLEKMRVAGRIVIVAVGVGVLVAGTYAVCNKSGGEWAAPSAAPGLYGSGGGDFGGGGGSPGRPLRAY
jgi:uncharacterized membrane protein YgcG